MLISGIERLAGSIAVVSCFIFRPYTLAFESMYLSPTGMRSFEEILPAFLVASAILGNFELTLVKLRLFCDFVEKLCSLGLIRFVFENNFYFKMLLMFFSPLMIPEF